MVGTSLMSRMMHRGSSKNLSHPTTTSQHHSGHSAPSSGGSNNSNDGDVKMMGWMKKQKETLRSWARRYFTLSGNVLTYYDSEDTSRAPRGKLDIVDVAPLTTENNGLVLHLRCGKEVRLIADTHVAYTAWLSLISASLKKPVGSGPTQAAKEGWAHCLAEEDVWTRYFVVVKNDTFSCYESDEEDAELTLSGLVRSVSEWDGKRFGIVVNLNMQRKFHLCFDSTEEKMSWLLTLEFAVSCAQARMKRLVSKRSSSLKDGPIMDKAALSSDSNPAATPAASGGADGDDGVWI